VADGSSRPTPYAAPSLLRSCRELEGESKSCLISGAVRGIEQGLSIVNQKRGIQKNRQHGLPQSPPRGLASPARGPFLNQQTTAIPQSLPIIMDRPPYSVLPRRHDNPHTVMDYYSFAGDGRPPSSVPVGGCTYAPRPPSPSRAAHPSFMPVGCCTYAPRPPSSPRAAFLPSVCGRPPLHPSLLRHQWWITRLRPGLRHVMLSPSPPSPPRVAREVQCLEPVEACEVNIQFDAATRMIPLHSW
jgi:hypothetical protein